MAKRSIPDTQTQGGVATKSKPQTKRPPLYCVLILNDDFTPMDFVISVLQSVFDKSAAEATDIMLQVHRSGAGVAGVYTLEVAETKAAQTIEMAKRSQHPLRCKVEKE